MSNSIKAFAGIITSFIDRTFLPILDTKIPEAIKAMDQWGQFKAFINETETIDIWKVEKLIAGFTSHSLAPPKLLPESPEKCTESEVVTTGYENGAWKYNISESIHCL